MPRRCAPSCPRRCGCSTPSTSPGSGSPPSTTCADGSSRNSPGTHESAGRRHDPLYRIRRVLRRGYEHHSERSWARLLAGLDAGDTTDEQLAKTWIAAQELRLLYRCPDRARAEQHLYAWLVHCADAGVPELLRLAYTIDAWRPELLAYFDTDRISNGPTEAINLLIKKIKRVGHGFRNFDNYRLRLLLHCGVEWHTPDATPTRGRLPRFVA
jgi:transposase